MNTQRGCGIPALGRGRI